ncbi:N-acetyltransferase family protein [Cronobacter dublinensis]
MNIRPWQESDRPFLRTIYLHARREGWPWLDGSEWRLEDFDADTLGETILVAEEDGHRLGFASLAEDDNFLHHLFVAPEAQGKGVGAGLLKAVQARFTSTGALKCLVKNTRALRFYAHHGWVREASGEAPEGTYDLLHFRQS